MELDKSYDLSLLGLEGYVREAYKNRLNLLRKTDSPSEQMNILKEMFSVLEESRPPYKKSDTFEWGKDRILAYKNLGRVFMGINVGENLDSLEEMTDFKRVLDEYDVETPEHLEEELILGEELSDDLRKMEKDLEILRRT